MSAPAAPGTDAPLAGVRVLDFTMSLSGPSCTWLLSCLGADVVKIEPPNGEYYRRVKQGTIFANVNRNKRSVAVDLRTEEGRRLAQEMTAHFDVLVESFKPGTMDSYGLSYEDVKARNPRMIYASISGYGQSGPYADRPGYDVIAQALSGMMAATGEPGREPVRVGTATVDYGTGVYAALGIVAAVRRRDQTGLGARVAASLLETATSFMSYYYTHYSAVGELPQRWGSANESFVPYQNFTVRDGAIFVGVATDRMFRDFCTAFGLDALGADPRLQTVGGRVAHRDEVVAAVQAALQSRTCAEVESGLIAIGVPTTRVLPVDEAIRQEQIVAEGIVTTIDDPEFGAVTVTPFPVHMDGVPRVAGRRAPALGADTDAVLGELGLHPRSDAGTVG